MILTLKLYIIFTIILIFLLFLINYFISQDLSYYDKLSSYECGINPLGTAREKFNIEFFIIGILFIIFDLEIILLFPYSIVIYNISYYGFTIMMIFFIIITIGLWFELNSNIFNYKNISINTFLTN